MFKKFLSWFWKEEKPKEVEQSTVQVKSEPVSLENTEMRVNAKDVSVLDGDTIYLKEIGKSVRLSQMDAPESDQKTLMGSPAGILAKGVLKSFLNNKSLLIKLGNLDPYNRLIGSICVDGKDISEKMIESGYAVPFGLNSSLDNKLVGAKINKAGLWALGGFEDPKKFRTRKTRDQTRQ